MWHVIVHVVLIGGQTKQNKTQQDKTTPAMLSQIVNGIICGRPSPSLAKN